MNKTSKKGKRNKKTQQTAGLWGGVWACGEVRCAVCCVWLWGLGGSWCHRQCDICWKTAPHCSPLPPLLPLPPYIAPTLESCQHSLKLLHSSLLLLLPIPQCNTEYSMYYFLFAVWLWCRKIQFKCQWQYTIARDVKKSALRLWCSADNAAGNGGGGSGGGMGWFSVTN